MREATVSYRPETLLGAHLFLIYLDTACRLVNQDWSMTAFRSRSTNESPDSPYDVALSREGIQGADEV